MVIVTSTGPANAADLLAPSLSHLLGPELKTRGLAPTGGSTQTTRAIPVFTVRLDEATDPDFVTRAQPRGWRYLILGKGPLAVADIRERKNGHAFAQLTKGVLAQRLADSAARAEKDYGSSREQYEARIIDIPPLGMSAFWLHSGIGDVFYPLHEGATQRAFKPAEDAQFVDRVVNAAQSLKGQPTLP